MSVSTNLRTDISKMLAYNKEPNSLTLKKSLPNIDIHLDDLPIIDPYVPRICDEQGYFLIWWGTQETDSDLLMPSLQAKTEVQWTTCKEEWKIEKGVSLVYPYDDEVIIGALKVPNYYTSKRSRVDQREWLRNMWRDIIKMFGDRRLICPSGGYFNTLHLEINKQRIPREAYHKDLMKQFQFKRCGNYWIREHD